MSWCYIQQGFRVCSVSQSFYDFVNVIISSSHKHIGGRVRFVNTARILSGSKHFILDGFIRGVVEYSLGENRK